MKVRALVLLLAAIPLAADNYPRQPDIDAQHYVFRVTLRDDTDEIAGEATASMRFLKDGLPEFALDLTSASSGKGMTVSDVSSGSTTLRYEHQANRLKIELDRPSQAGEVREFTVRYHGIPGDGLKIGKNKYGERCFFSLNWPILARQWLPLIDHPYDKATSEFLITAPAEYQVVANGSLEEETDLGDGRRLTHWKESAPIASWLNAIGVARFSSRHYGTAAGIPLETWVYHQDRDNGIVTFESSTRQAIEFYANQVGPYPYEKLANVVAPGLHGGNEHASAIFYGEATLGTRPNTGVVWHEIAHQWFGDSVTEKDWDDVWLSEGFATYFTLLATEHYAGRDAFLAGLKRSRGAVFRQEQTLPDDAVVHHNIAETGRILNQLVYEKGGWVLHMLRRQVGNARFWAGIREYCRRYRDSNASTADFRQVMEEASGVDLGWFFQQWLYRPGTPVLDGGWHYDAGRRKIEIELSQTQPGEAFRLPIEIGVTVEGAPLEVEKREMTAKQQRFEIASEKAPVDVLLDPNVWVLMRARFVKR